MAVFRVERNTGYTVMSNHHLRNKELSLLYYFFSMTDAEIAELMKVPRSTVQYRRTSSFELLKRYLEERADEWNEL